MEEKIKVKVIKIEPRESFAQVILEYKGERYEGLLLKSGKKNKEDRNH